MENQHRQISGYREQKCEHGLSLAECYVRASRKYGSVRAGEGEAMMPPLPNVGGYVYNESGLMLSVSEEAAVERLLLAYGRAVAEACICENE